MQTTHNQPANPTNIDGCPRYDERATKIVQLHIDNDEPLYHLADEIVTRAYEDAELATAADPDAITSPRADAGDAIREYFEEKSPLAEQGSVYSTLLDFALDRCNWYAIVDDIRDRMTAEEEALAALQASERGVNQ